MLGHTEHTLAHITLVPVVAVKARDLGEALERLSTLRYSSPPRPRLKLEAISPPPCDVHMFSGSPLSRAAGSQLGTTPPHMLRTAATACCAQRPFVGSASSQPR